MEGIAEHSQGVERAQRRAVDLEQQIAVAQPQQHGNPALPDPAQAQTRPGLPFARREHHLADELARVGGEDVDEGRRHLAAQLPTPDRLGRARDRLVAHTFAELGPLLHPSLGELPELRGHPAQFELELLAGPLHPGIDLEALTDVGELLLRPTRRPLGTPVGALTGGLRQLPGLLGSLWRTRSQQ